MIVRESFYDARVCVVEEIRKKNMAINITIYSSVAMETTSRTNAKSSKNSILVCCIRTHLLYDYYSDLDYVVPFTIWESNISALDFGIRLSSSSKVIIK
jgi:hypothetical protein